MKRSIKLLSIVSCIFFNIHDAQAKPPHRHKFTLVNRFDETLTCTINFSGRQCSSMKFNPARFRLKPNHHKTIFVPHECKVSGITALNEFATGPISTNTYVIDKNLTLYITNDRGITQRCPDSTQPYRQPRVTLKRRSISG